MTTPDRAAEARAVPLLSVFSALDIRPSARGTYGPCPACGATSRGQEDRRGPLGLSPSREGWRCHRCDARGDGLTAVRARVGDWPAVWGWYADRGWCTPPADHRPRPVPPPRPAPPPPPPKPPVPVEEVRALLRRCVDVPADVPDRRLVSPLARWLPEGVSLPRWAASRDGTWQESGHRVLIPLWDARGLLAGVRARAADRAAAHPKARPPVGHAIGPVCMASPTALRWLRGGPSPEGVVIVEGEPAWIAWATAHPALAVLGIVSGSWSPEWSERVGDLPALVVLDRDGGEASYLRSLASLRNPVRWPHGKDDVPGVRGAGNPWGSW